MRNFHSISEQKKKEVFADALVMREEELFGYESNIENYTAMLATLPQGEWPENLISYKGQDLQFVPLELVAQVTEYNLRDRLQYLLKTETAEMTKSEKIYNTIVSKLPTEELSTLVAGAINRRNGVTQGQR